MYSIKFILFGQKKKLFFIKNNLMNSGLNCL